RTCRGRRNSRWCRTALPSRGETPSSSASPYRTPPGCKARRRARAFGRPSPWVRAWSRRRRAQEMRRGGTATSCGGDLCRRYAVGARGVTRSRAVPRCTVGRPARTGGLPAVRPEEFADVLGEERRLFHRGEVTAARHLGPARDAIAAL